MAVEVKIGDTVKLKKQHPCGSFEWEITRVGADIGLQCLGCNHKVLLDRKNFERRVRAVNRE